MIIDEKTKVTISLWAMMAGLPTIIAFMAALIWKVATFSNGLEAAEANALSAQITAIKNQDSIAVLTTTTAVQATNITNLATQMQRQNDTQGAQLTAIYMAIQRDKN